MTYEEKIEHLVLEGRFAGIGYHTIIPPAYLPLWRLGIKLPPPLLSGFWPVMLSLTLFFGLSMGIFATCFLAFIFWSALGRSPPLEEDFLFTTVVAGLVGPPFGLAMAIHYWWLRRKFKLPRWKDYPGPSRRAQRDPS